MGILMMSRSALCHPGSPCKHLWHLIVAKGWPVLLKLHHRYILYWYSVKLHKASTSSIGSLQHPFGGYV